MEKCTIEYGGHSWMAGMMVVPDEDLDEIAAMRRANGADPITCQRCEAEYHRAEQTCPKCGRPLRPWPLRRPAACSPKGWAACIRNDL